MAVPCLVEHEDRRETPLAEWLEQPLETVTPQPFRQCYQHWPSAQDVCRLLADRDRPTSVVVERDALARGGDFLQETLVIARDPSQIRGIEGYSKLHALAQRVIGAREDARAPEESIEEWARRIAADVEDLAD